MSQSFAKITFFTISLRIFKDLTFFQFCSVERQNGNFIFAFCFRFGETYPNEKYEIKKNLCTKKMSEASASALGHQTDAIFKIKMKRPNPYRHDEPSYT